MAISINRYSNGTLTAVLYCIFVLYNMICHSTYLPT